MSRRSIPEAQAKTKNSYRNLLLRFVWEEEDRVIYDDSSLKYSNAAAPDGSLPTTGAEQAGRAQHTGPVVRR